jgi:hypothetical protein
MIDITAPKISIPTALFIIMSSVHKNSVYIRAALFAIIYRLIAYYQGIILLPADLIVPTALFMLLSPGIIFTLPSSKIASGETNLTAILIHAFVFAIVFAFLRKSFPQYY